MNQTFKLLFYGLYTVVGLMLLISLPDWFFLFLDRDICFLLWFVVCLAWTLVMFGD